jgi:hypothetical protein
VLSAFKCFWRRINMSVLKKICTGLLLSSLLALAGCPGMAQQGGSSSGDSGNEAPPAEAR